jgi:hypothetical protein
MQDARPTFRSIVRDIALDPFNQRVFGISLIASMLVLMPVVLTAIRKLAKAAQDHSRPLAPALGDALGQVGLWALWSLVLAMLALVIASAVRMLGSSRAS